VYAQILRGYWPLLPAALRDLHSRITVRATGRFTISSPPGWLAAAVRALARLPAPAADIPVTLRITRSAGGEHWERTFGSACLSTVQRVSGLLLEERFGLLELTFCLSPDASGITFHQTHAALRLVGLRVPLHSRVAPRVWAVESAIDEARIGVVVTANLPLIGELIRYEGWIAASEAVP
jgi:hypothetical protein